MTEIHNWTQEANFTELKLKLNFQVGGGRGGGGGASQEDCS